MAGGWAKDGAIQDQIDSTINDAVALARSRMTDGKNAASLSECEECGDAIPLARQEAIQGVRLCITCQTEEDQRTAKSVGFNRSGSKGSQMR